MENTLTKIFNFFLAIFLFLLPLFFLPVTANFYEFNKNILLYFGVGILLLLWAGEAAAKKELRLTKTPLDLPILFFATAFCLATFFASPNKMEAFWLPGGTGTILALTLLYFLITNHQKILRWLPGVLVGSATLLALIAVWQFVGVGEIYAPAQWMKNKLWTPADNPLSLITFLAAVLPLSLISFFKSLGGRVNWKGGIFFGTTSVFLILGLALTVWQILPGKGNPLFILPYPTAWAIAIESFKQSPLFGVGPENFSSAFGRFRPINFNRLDIWTARFGVSSSYPLHLLTVGGVFCLAGFVIMVITIIKIIARKQEKEKTWAAAILTTLVLLLFLPSSFLLLLAFFVYLAELAPKKEGETYRLGEKIRWAPLALTLILVGTSYYFAGRAYAGEIYFKKSLDALAQNRGLDVYNNQIKAIQFNPRRTLFRLAYSQTNFALANNLASKKDLTDQDRANITQLIQQAISEAKAATALNPTETTNWQNLAQIYRNLINFAQGADQWAVAAYQQAILTDPVNPLLRLDLGGLFYSLGNYEAAQRQFENVVALKPDYANGYYNLAAALREQKKYDQAYQAMQQTLGLVPVDSSDWQKAKEELDELEKKLPKPETSPTPTPTPQVTPKPEEVLSEPQPLPSPVLEKPIELPSEEKKEE